MPGKTSLYVLTGFLLVFFWAFITMAPITPCLADMDTDGDIDAKDLQTLSEELAQVSCGACLSDLDRDGSVDPDDIRRLAEGFGRIGCPEIAYKLYGINFSPNIDGQDPNQGATVDEDQIRERMQIVVPSIMSKLCALLEPVKRIQSC
jgi:hypothetical protein